MTRTFFTDRDLGKTFPTILADAGLHVERHADHFPADCPDEHWLQEVGKRRWIAVTHDQRIRYKPNELNAVIRHDVALLVVVGKTRFADLAENFVATLPKIDAFLDRHRPPLIGKVHQPPGRERSLHRNKAGSIVLWYPQPE